MIYNMNYYNIMKNKQMLVLLSANTQIRLIKYHKYIMYFLGC